MLAIGNDLPPVDLGRLVSSIVIVGLIAPCPCSLLPAPCSLAGSESEYSLEFGVAVAVLVVVVVSYKGLSSRHEDPQKQKLVG